MQPTSHHNCIVSYHKSRFRTGVIGLSMLAFFGLLTAGVYAELALDNPHLAALLEARAAAETDIGSGYHANAMEGLLQSLRALPGDRPELADAAYGNGQMVAYILLHLMPEAEAWGFLETGFDPAAYETDRMVKALCSIAIGLDSEDKMALSREATYLTTSENHIVRAISMYYLSNPYFYDNAAFTDQYAALLARDYPALELTQTSLNLSLYAKRQNATIADLAKGIGEKGSALPYQPWSKSLRERIAACKSVDGKGNGTTLKPLLDGITEATDWRERHFALLLMKQEFSGTLATEMRTASRALAGRAENTPDVLQARLLLAAALSADCKYEGRDSTVVAEVVELARLLLDRGVGETTPERVLWESWAYGLQKCASNLAEAGFAREASEIYAGISGKIPGSKIAAACDKERGALFFHKPLTTNDKTQD